MSSIDDSGIAPNAKRLLWAGFMAILAAGVGFSIRGGILGDWGEQFGFTQGDLGKITGGGLTGFGIIILIGALLADQTRLWHADVFGVPRSPVLGGAHAGRDADLQFDGWIGVRSGKGDCLHVSVLGDVLVCNRQRDR